ncbi:putative tubulin polyglutamylase TTLL2 [Chanos chanos]|uniref:Tubulin polyglutamylase TTLL2 n=1 Tax=Chanos chanos TaxID=29144 RepID=A0A6J2V124_CHACN|nr:probable tubulin polyglutamylase TTLL2 [Chanos chanos]
MAMGVSGAMPLVFRLHEGTPDVVREVLLERGWEEYNAQEQEEGDWNLYWRASSFSTSDYANILPWQRLNHHPKTDGITRKDCLARNIRRMRGAFGPALYDFSPTAFILPNEYIRFLEEYTKNRVANRGRSDYWICKPVDLSRGRGIFIFDDIKDLAYDSSVIVQKYVSNPFLISGYKFDLRIYVCVKSFHPLQIYMHQEGLVRFATEKYNLTSLNNLYSHLTNTSINKFGPFYATEKERVGQGCKWTMSKFRCFLHSQGINEPFLWQRINSIVTLTLLTIAPSIPTQVNCLELFGFDILIDANFKPWLLEVNCSPALSLDCPADIKVKKGLINDVIDLMNYRTIDSLRYRGYLKQKHCYLGSWTGLPKSLPVRLQSKSTYEVHSYPSGNNHLNNADNTGRLSVEISRLCLSGNCASDTTSCAFNSKRLKSKTAAVIRNKRARPSVGRAAEPSQRSEVTAVELESDDNERVTRNHRGPTFRHSALNARRLPPIHLHKHKPLTFQWCRRSQDKTRPAFRVGDFILTFPFNEVTWKASWDELDVKTVVQEIHKLNVWVASSSHHREGKRTGDCQINGAVKDQFGSLFWGPRNPPLLSECCFSG